MASVAAGEPGGDGQAETVAPSRRRARPRGAVAFLVGFLVVFATAEVGVRMAGGRLPEPREYYSMRAQVLVDEMDALEEAGVRSDLTFVGTSMVGRATVPSVYEEEIDSVEWAHNLALPAGQTPVIRRWLLEEVVPRIDPRVVVWGISSLDFNGGRVEKIIDKYDEARATRSGWLGAADRVLANLGLSRHREELRDPVSLGSIVSGSSRVKRHGKLAEMGRWDLVYPELPPERLERLRRQHLEMIGRRQLAGFRIGETEMDAFTETLEDLESRGIEVVVVLWPVTTGYVGAHPRGEADFEAWKDAVLRETGEREVAVVDLSSAMPDEDFRDYEHLEVDAAARFSAMLAGELAAMGG